MTKGLQSYDYIVFVLYFLLIASYGYWIYNRKKAATVNTTDFFLAEGQLTWWAIGASLIASNISAEQFIGMSGNGFKLGLAISAYEWLAAISLVVVGVFFMPVYLKNKIYTMPQFLKTRYNETVAMMMAIFWLFLYIIVNLTSILFLGAIAINSLTGGTHFHLIMIGLAIFSLFITLGGMKVIGYTDVIQVLVLTIGGLITSYIALTVVSNTFGYGNNALAGLNHLVKAAPEHFKMIFDKPTAGSTQKQIDDYSSLPGLAMMAAGMWVANLNYWGCNQYITQRALGSDLKTARSGIFFAAILKLFMPLLVVIPGICAFVLYQNGQLHTEMITGGELKPDNAYSSVIGFLPIGLKGLSMAALTAAIVASLAGKANSISTIFSLDIYKKYLNKKSSDINIVKTGRIVIIISLIIAILINWNDTLGIGGKGGFEFIQKYTGYISPVIFPVFLLGFFWKKTTSKAAIWGIILGLVLSVLFDKFLPGMLGNETILYTALPNGHGGYEIPYLIQMGWVFLFTCIIMIVISLIDVKGQTHANDLQEDATKYKLTNTHIAMIMTIIIVVAGLYIKFW
jgi:solute:Na+ symporter, SSS family